MTSTARVYLAVDLGASSGRIVAGSFDQRRLELTEVYRFENGPTGGGPRPPARAGALAPVGREACLAPRPPVSPFPTGPAGRPER